MREILFKGRRIDNGEWVKGYYLMSGGDHFIHAEYIEDFCMPVVTNARIIPETICQYTGLTDKNGEEIWENDIVMHEDQYAPVKFGLYMQSPYYYKNIYGFYVDFPEDTLLRKDFGFWHKKVEVVGNIFDNLELLREVPE